jgi:hypothetical protein
MCDPATAWAGLREVAQRQTTTETFTELAECARQVLADKVIQFGTIQICGVPLP